MRTATVRRHRARASHLREEAAKCESVQDKEKLLEAADHWEAEANRIEKLMTVMPSTDWHS